jgi:hypothetical protein
MVVDEYAVVFIQAQARVGTELKLKVPNLDIQIFQQLPLYVKMRVLRDGKTIFCKNEDSLYDLSFSTIRQFENFKPRYLSYLEGVLYA